MYRVVAIIWFKNDFYKCAGSISHPMLTITIYRQYSTMKLNSLHQEYRLEVYLIRSSYPAIGPAPPSSIPPTRAYEESTILVSDCVHTYSERQRIYPKKIGLRI